MLVIRTEQIKVFDEVARRRFEDEMMLHSKEFSPKLSEIIGDEQLRVAVRMAMARADKYEFTNRGSIRLFIELTFLCGSAFDTDPQYAALGTILRGSDDQMTRAEHMHSAFLEYLENVCGPDNAYVRGALTELALFARTPAAYARGFVPGMLEEMRRVYPQKAAYVGEQGLTGLINEAIAEARRYRFNNMRHGALLVALMFSFGHGCTDDPLYPWISRTLKDNRIVDPTARAERLEKKALTWLEQVLTHQQGGVRK